MANIRNTDTDHSLVGYSKGSPILGTLRSHFQLGQNTYHLTIDLGQASLAYIPGDTIGIFPKYTLSIVEKTLHAMQADASLKVPTTHSETFSISETLRSRFNLSSVPLQLFKRILPLLSITQQTALSPLLEPDRYLDLKSFLDSYEIWDFLHAHPHPPLHPEEYLSLFKPILPRFYSISSSHRHVGQEIHLTVAHVVYKTNGQERRGVASHYLCRDLPLHSQELPLFIHSAPHFRLPADPNIPIIMIGPGTGVAPFRAFLQERIFVQRATGKHWLFFGTRSQHTDFYYRNEWPLFQKEGSLRLDCAFSRDQEERIYVQHRMLASGAEIYTWLQEGAYLYVCGNASHMAKDVEATLLQICMEQGNMSREQGLLFIKELRREKRYCRDIY